MNKPIGASYLRNGRCLFSVWAPLKNKMVLHIISPEERLVEMSRDQYGYFYTEADNIYPDTEYFFRPDDEEDYPDPASRYQPHGVAGASAVTENDFKWTDASWKNIPFDDLIIYELHTGTFTPEGTFEAIISRLDELSALGINAIELMPVTQFPGARNWGYDAVFPYAVQNSYGGPQGLKKLVNACHQKGIAVFLDLVYNHLGPEGNYFQKFAPYFNDHYSTPWGDALNYDADWSDGVRDFFSDNALYWFNDFHIDGLRLDAIHMLFDNGAIHF
ncbi:MAG: malto-oligosyltrehalose trehalohydrolase, partial [Chitinophagaceae bacterium]|nr:malto-oligosyltrehalose trehalohydrolase [Chitinophagaceae bacterium]